MVPPSHSRISRFHRWLASHPGLVLVGATLVFVLSGALAWRLKLRTSFAELLPSNDPGVVALTRTQKRMGDLSLLLIGIRSPDYQANLRYAEALTQKLRAQPPTVVNLATYHVRDVRDFFERNKWLYVTEDNLEAIRDRLRSEISKRKNPLYVSLGEDESIDAMRARMSGKSGLDDKFPGGVFTSTGRRIRLDRGAAAGRAVRRERGRGAVQRRQQADRARPTEQLSPRHAHRGGRADRRPRSPADTPSSATSSGSPSPAW